LVESARSGDAGGVEDVLASNAAALSSRAAGRRVLPVDLNGGCRLVRSRGGPTTCPSSRPARRAPAPRNSGDRQKHQRDWPQHAEQEDRAEHCEQPDRAAQQMAADRGRRERGAGGRSRHLLVMRTRDAGGSPGRTCGWGHVHRRFRTHARRRRLRSSGPTSWLQLHSGRSARVGSRAISECPSRPCSLLSSSPTLTPADDRFAPAARTRKCCSRPVAAV
jgi:hypothetical protein